MDKLISRIDELLKIKSIVTIVLLVAVVILALTDRVSADVITGLFGSVIGYYFSLKNAINNKTSEW